MNKKITIIIISIIILVIITGIICGKIFIYDPMQKKKALETQINLIMKYYTDGEYETAKNLIQELVIDNSDNNEVTRLLEMIIKADKEKRELEQQERDKKYAEYQHELLLVLKNILSESRRGTIINSQYFENLENVLDKLKQPSEVKKTVLNEIKSLKPEANKLINQGIDAYNQKDYALAKTLLTNALHIDNDNAYANAYLGASLFEENPDDIKNIEQASIRCTRAVSENENLEIAHFILGKIYAYKNFNNDAVYEFHESIRINPNNFKANYEAGRIYFIQNDYNTAKTYFLNAVKVKPDYIDSLYYLGQIEKNQKNYGKAKKYFKDILVYDNNFYLSYINLALIFKENNDYSNAVDNYIKANKIEENYKNYFEIAECYKVLKTSDDKALNKAIENYEKSISLNPAIDEKEIDFVITSYYSLIDIYKELDKRNKIEEIYDILNQNFPEEIEKIKSDL